MSRSHEQIPKWNSWVEAQRLPSLANPRPLTLPELRFRRAHRPARPRKPIVRTILFGALAIVPAYWLFWVLGASLVALQPG